MSIAMLIVACIVFGAGAVSALAAIILHQALPLRFTKGM